MNHEVFGPVHVDVLDQTLMAQYAAATGITRTAVLGQDLAQGWREGRFKRMIVNLTGLSKLGLPKWVFSYSLSKEPNEQRDAGSRDNGDGQ